MKEKTKFGIYGLIIILLVILSVYPMSRIKPDIYFLYAIISWNMMFYITVIMFWWLENMRRINQDIKHKEK